MVDQYGLIASMPAVAISKHGGDVADKGSHPCTASLSVAAFTGATLDHHKCFWPLLSKDSANETPVYGWARCNRTLEKRFVLLASSDDDDCRWMIV